MIARFAFTVALAALTLAACKDNPKTDTPGKDTAKTAGSTDNTVIDSKAGRYAIKVPTTMTQRQEQQVPIQTAVGPVMMNMTLMQSPDGNSATMIAYCDYPEAIFKNMKISRDSAIQVMFDSARVGGLRNIQNAKLTDEKRITLNNMPGRSITFNGEMQGKPIHARFDYYMDIPRLYQVGYLSTDSTTLGSEPILAMFRSLQVTPAPSAPAPDTGK